MMGRPATSPGTAVTPLTKALISSGEVSGRVKENRENSELEVSDRIALRWAAAGELGEALREHAALVATEVLATSLDEAAVGDDWVADPELGLAFSIAKA